MFKAFVSEQKCYSSGPLEGRVIRILKVFFCIFSGSRNYRKNSESELSLNYDVRSPQYFPVTKSIDNFPSSPEYIPVTGKSFSETLILASTNPKYDKRLFIELLLY